MPESHSIYVQICGNTGIIKCVNKQVKHLHNLVHDNIISMSLCLLQVNVKMREIAEREHKVKHHHLESPSHQKVKPLTVS